MEGYNIRNLELRIKFATPHGLTKLEQVSSETDIYTSDNDR